MKPLNLLILFIAIATAVASARSESFEVKVTGEGSPLIFIPGLACDGSVWDATVERYAKTHECHVLTLAGFGASKLPPLENDAFLKTVADDLANYIASEHLNDPVIIGHSLGGFVSLLVSIDHPDLAKQLVIVDSLPFLPAVTNPAATVEAVKDQAVAQRSAMLQGQQNETSLRMMLNMMVTAPADIDRALAMSMQSKPQSVAQAMYELQTTDLRSDVSKIQTPTLVLGAWVAYKPYGSTKESTAAIFNQQYAQHPNYHLAMSDHGKHFIMWDDPDFLYAQLDTVLAK